MGGACLAKPLSSPATSPDSHGVKSKPTAISGERHDSKPSNLPLEQGAVHQVRLPHSAHPVLAPRVAPAAPAPTATSASPGCPATSPPDTPRPPNTNTPSPHPHPNAASSRLSPGTSTGCPEAKPRQHQTCHEEDAWGDWDDPEEEASTASDEEGQQRPGPSSAVPSEAVVTSAIRPDWQGGVEGRYCEGPCIGGTAFEDRGELSDKLRCLLCGYPVMRFARSRWDGSTDYFHLRNHMPDQRMASNAQAMQQDMEKLRAKLLPDEACAAYACGCSYQSVTALKQLRSWGTDPGEDGAAGSEGAKLKWVANSN